MPILRTIANSREGSSAYYFEGVLSEQWELKNDVTDRPIQGGESTMEFASDHIQTDPRRLSIEFIVTENPLQGSPALQNNASPTLRRAHMHEWFLANRQRLFYYSSIHFGVFGPCAIETLSEPVELAGRLICPLTLKEVAIGETKEVALPPRTPKRRKPKKNPGPTTKDPKDGKGGKIIKRSILSRGAGRNEGATKARVTAAPYGTQFVQGVRVIPKEYRLTGRKLPTFNL